MRKDGNKALEYCTDHSSTYMALDRNIAQSVVTSKFPISQSSSRSVIKRLSKFLKTDTPCFLLFLKMDTERYHFSVSAHPRVNQVLSLVSPLLCRCSNCVATGHSLVPLNCLFSTEVSCLSPYCSKYVGKLVLTFDSKCICSHFQLF